MKKLLIGAAAILMVGAAAFLIIPRFTSGPAGRAMDTSDYPRFTVEQISSAETIEVSGNIEAIDAQTSVFTIDGVVDRILASIGEAVTPGMVVITMESAQLRYDRAQAEYNLEQGSFDASPREIELLTMERDIAIENLDKADITSDINGIVSEITVDEGDYAEAGDEAVRIVDLSRLMAEVNVDEIDAPYLLEGQQVVFIFDAFPDEEYLGYVSRISVEGEVNDNDVAVVSTTLILEEPDAKLKPGYTFTAIISVSDEQDRFIVEKDAVMSQGTELEGFGRVLTSEGQWIPVQYSEYDASRYEISGEIQEGLALVSIRAMLADAEDEDGEGFSIPGMPGSGTPGGGMQPPGGGAPPGGGSGPGGPPPSGGNSGAGRGN